MIHLDTGSYSEAKILAHFIKIGIKVYVAWNQNTRSDFIIEVNNSLFRVQCKTAWEINNGESLMFNTSSSNARTKGKTYYGESDIFAVYYDRLDKVYIIKVTWAPSKSCTLRLLPTKNNNSINIHWAKDYELTRNTVWK